jgi:hypothetical protein
LLRFDGAIKDHKNGLKNLLCDTKV